VADIVRVAARNVFAIATKHLQMSGSEQESVKVLILGGFLQYTFLAVNAVGKQNPTKMPQSLGLRCGNVARRAGE
jgi:hypothetical protein